MNEGEKGTRAKQFVEAALPQRVVNRLVIRSNST